MTGETGTVKKGFFIPTWLIAVAALALIAAAAVQFGGNTSPATSTQSAINAEPPGSSSSGGIGNMSASDDSDGVKVEGFNKATLAYDKQGAFFYSFNKDKTVYKYSADDQGINLLIVAKKDDFSKLKSISYDNVVIKNIYYIYSEDDQAMTFWANIEGVDNNRFSDTIISETLPIQKGKFEKASNRIAPRVQPKSKNDVLLFVRLRNSGENLAEQNPYYIIHIYIKNNR